MGITMIANSVTHVTDVTHICIYTPYLLYTLMPVLSLRIELLEVGLKYKNIGHIGNIGHIRHKSAEVRIKRLL
jgi:hypothetical protein